MASPTSHPALMLANKGKSFTCNIKRTYDQDRGEIGAAIIAVLADENVGNKFKVKRQHKRTVFLTYIVPCNAFETCSQIAEPEKEREEKNVTKHKKYCSLGHYGGCFPHTHTQTNKQYVTV
jgi:hypothetical protein